MTLRQRYIVGFMVLVAVSFLAWRFAPRFGSAPRTSNAALPGVTPGFVADDEIRHEVRPTRKTVESDVEHASLRVATLINEAFEANPQLPDKHADQFVEAIKESLLLYLDPDFDRWVEHCKNVGGVPYDSMNGKHYFLPDGGTDANFRERWILSSSQLSLSPFSTKHISFRPLWINGVQREYPQPPFFLGAGFRNGRSFPENPARYKATSYEVLIPILSSSADTPKPSREMHLAISFWWDKELLRWIPHETRLYANNTGPETHYFLFL